MLPFMTMAIKTKRFRRFSTVASLLKCQLLVACYAETFDDELAKEAHEIINAWEGRDLTLAEREVFDYLESLEANPYPNWEEVE